MPILMLLMAMLADMRTRTPLDRAFGWRPHPVCGVIGLWLFAVWR